MEILFRSWENMVTVSFDKINKEIIKNIFLQKNVDSIYVLNENKSMVGMITTGRFSRNLSNQNNWIEKNFTFFKFPVEDTKVKEAFTKQSVQSIPVLNTEGTLYGEYYINTAEKLKDYQEETKSLMNCLTDVVWDQNRVSVVTGADEWSRKVFRWLQSKEKNVIWDKNYNNKKEHCNIISPYPNYVKRLRMFYEDQSANFYDINSYLIHYAMDLDRMLQDTVGELNKHNVSCHLFRIPGRDDDVNVTEKALWRRKNNVRLDTFQLKMQDIQYRQQIQEVYGEDYSEEFIRDIIKCPQSFNISGKQYYQDMQIEGIKTYEQGRRKTCFQPEEEESILYVFGKCTVEGIYVKDKDTIPSLLQQNLQREKETIGRGVRVENFGFSGPRYLYLKWLQNICFQENDIVIILDNIPADIDCIDLTQILNDKLKTEEWYFNQPEHCNARANRVMAEEIYHTLQPVIQNPVRNEYVDCRHSFGNKDEGILKEYLVGVKEAMQKKWGTGKRKETLGAIVMNCNPFTLGHKYLIEQARKQVSKLLIFVVEEDKSYFTFQERFMLVKEGTAEWSNVLVVPSGQFILSALTFGEYFMKDLKQEVIVNPVKDVNLFATIIAPALGITVRFVGTEPIDKVTEQYNSTMQQILPRYGVRLEILKRKTIHGLPVSASYVRKLLEEGRFEEAKEFLPDSTSQRLQNVFSPDNSL